MNKQCPFFSIIMPVYNTEKYVETAIQSVLKQSYVDFELIIVDDQSTDNSYYVCKKIEQQDKRVKVVQAKHNSGAAAARNLAFHYIQGQYILFVDSDDTIDKNLLESAYTYMQDTSIDCLKFGCIEEYFNENDELKYTKKCSLKNCIYETPDTIRKQMVQMELIPLFGYLCNTVYKSSIILDNCLQFNEHYRVNEDFDFNIRYFKYVHRLRCIDYCGYHYAKRFGSGSLSSQKNDEYYNLHMMKIREFLQCFSSIETIDQQTLSNIFWLYTRFVYSAIQRKVTNQEPINEFIKEIKTNKLFLIYQTVDFLNMNYKQKIMISLLRSSHSQVFRILIRCIGFIRTYCPVVFAVLKR